MCLTCEGVRSVVHNKYLEVQVTTNQLPSVAVQRNAVSLLIIHQRDEGERGTGNSGHSLEREH